MKIPTRRSLTTLWPVLAWTLVATAADNATDLSARLPAIARHQFGQDRRALTEVEKLIRDNQDLAQRRAIERQLATILDNPAATADAKQWVCRQLWILGTAESVPALSRLLADEKLADMACYALGRNPSPEAGQALCDALLRAQGPARVAILNAIGDRRTTACLSELTRVLDETDAAATHAAALALGKIGGDDAVAALRAFRARATGALRDIASEAYLRSAEPYLGSRMYPQAAAIYRELLESNELKSIQRGALLGLARADQADAIRRALVLLSRPDVWSRGSALACVRLMRNGEAVAQFAAALPTLPAEAQVLLLGALADRGDLAARPAIVVAAKSDNENVRAAAWLALGRLGDVSAVNLLADAASKSASQSEKSAALMSLRLLPGNAVNAALAALIRSSPAAARVDLIAVLAERNAVSEMPLLVQLAGTGDAATRRASLKALGRLGGEADLPTLTRLLVSLDDETAREAAEQAVAEVAQRIPDPDRRANAVLAALPGANTAAARTSLLRVLATTPSQPALAAVVAATQDRDDAVKDVAVRELANWPSPGAIEPLASLAGAAPNRTHRVLALRGYLRLLAASDRPNAEKLTRYRAVLQQAQSAGEKKLVLAGLAGVTDPEALRLAQSFLADPETQAEAAQAMTQIAGRIYVMQPAEARAALAQVQAAVTDAGARQQVEAVLKQIDALQDYLTSWQVAGPFEQAGKNYAALFDVEFAPEKLSAPGVNWRPLPASAARQRPPFIMDLLAAFGGENRVAYARTWVFSDSARPARLEIGSDDGAKVWVNGERVLAVNVARPITPGSEKADVKLKAGWNELLLKITQNNQGWEFTARLVKPDGSRISGLRVSNEPPK